MDELDLMMMGDEFGGAIGEDEFGGAIGEDEFGASKKNWFRGGKTKEEAVSSLRNARKHVIAMARRGSVSRSQLGALVTRLGRLEQAVFKSFKRPVGPGFAGPGRPSGSHGVPLGLGTAAVASGGTGTLQQSNVRNAVLRIRRIVLAAGSAAGADALSSIYVTSITIGELPVQSGGNLPGPVFDIRSVSPVHLDHPLHPGGQVTVALAGFATNSATVQVSGSAECGQWSGAGRFAGQDVWR